MTWMVAGRGVAVDEPGIAAQLETLRDERIAQLLKEADVRQSS